MSFGATLRKMRFSRRPYLSQARLAERASFDHSYISRCESGTRQPSRPAVDALADALGATDAERDRLLAADGFLPLSAVDPLIVELLDALTNPRIPASRRDALRALVQMQTRWTVAWEAQPDFNAAAVELAIGLAVRQ